MTHAVWEFTSQVASGHVAMIGALEEHTQILKDTCGHCLAHRSVKQPAVPAATLIFLIPLGILQPYSSQEASPIRPPPSGLPGACTAQLHVPATPQPKMGSRGILYVQCLLHGGESSVQGL